MPRPAQRVPDGQPANLHPLGDGIAAARPAEHRTNSCRQHGDQRMASSLKPTRIGNLPQARPPRDSLTLVTLHETWKINPSDSLESYQSSQLQGRAMPVHD